MRYLGLLARVVAILHLTFSAYFAFAQSPCSTLLPPTFTRPHPCFNEYFTSITASGNMGTTSSISISSGCTAGGYTDLSATQGIDAPVGATVTLNVSRFTTDYTAYLSVYIDWDNDSVFEAHEHAGWPTAPTKDIQLDPSVLSASYSIAPPCGAPAGTFRMRVMISEALLNLQAPCVATYGQAYDFYYRSYCPGTYLTGDTAMCRRDSVNLSPSYGCGWWYSSDTSIAKVDSSGKVKSGFNSGQAVIYYESHACGISKDTISVGPAPITGSNEVCLGRNTLLSSSSIGGEWISGNPSCASVTSSGGVLTGMATGTCVIYYSHNSCYSTLTVSVNSEVIVSGRDTVCFGGTIPLTVVRTGGTWTSSNSSVATVGSSGIVSGVSVGSITISYETPDGGCMGYKHLVVIDPSISVAAPSGFSGQLCETRTATFSGSPTGGTWQSSNQSVAGILGGMTTGHSAGTATITYHIAGCIETYQVTVNAKPSISGPTSVCVGSTISLTFNMTGGTWYVDPFVANIASAGTGTITVTGIAAQTSSIVSYTEPTWGCKAIHYVDVGGTTITGSTLKCVGNVAFYSGWPSSGTWSSSNTSVATINSVGFASMVSVGTTRISYSIGGCSSYKVLTVQPTVIEGPDFVCTGSTIALTANMPSGTWSSSNTAVLTINSSGVATGHAAGTALVSYTGECSAAKVITVGTTPALSIISANTTICSGPPLVPLKVAANISGGAWNNSPNVYLTMGATTDARNAFLFDTLAVTSNYITYSVSYGANSCITTLNFTTSNPRIEGLPPGNKMGFACYGNATYSLSADSPPCTWASSNPSIATVSSGLLSGMSNGTATITVTNSKGCSNYAYVKVIGLGSCSSPPICNNHIRIACGNSTYHGHSTIQIIGSPINGYHFENADPSIYTLSTTPGIQYQDCVPCMPHFVEIIGITWTGISGAAHIYYVEDVTNIRVAEVVFTH